MARSPGETSPDAPRPEPNTAEGDDDAVRPDSDRSAAPDALSPGTLSPNALSPAVMARLRLLALGLAFGLWFVQMIGHGQGNRLAGWAFKQLGFVLGERLCLIGAAVIALAAVAVGLGRILGERRRHEPGSALRRALDGRLRELLGHALAGLLLAVFAERLLVVLWSELYHFVQFGVIGALLAFAWPRPGAVVLITTLLGFGDEWWQSIALHPDHPENHLDWNDVVLDLVGAVGGVVAVELARLPGLIRKLARRKPEASTETSAEASTDDVEMTLRPPEPNSLSALLIVSWLAALGAYGWTQPVSSLPFWKDWGGIGGKPFHSTAPAEGLVLTLALTTALCLIMKPGRRLRFAIALLALISGLGAVARARATAPPNLQPPRPIAYACRAATPPTIDGRLDEDLWRRTPSNDIKLSREGAASPVTATAWLAWNETHLFLALRCQDIDILARETGRDDPLLPADEVVELFLDPVGDGRRWIELEVSPAGAIYDLEITARPGRTPHFAGDSSWNATGLKVAVELNGTIDAPRGNTIDQDQGWTVELALPFADLPESLRRSPAAGDVWRMNLFRVERPRNGTAPSLVCWSPSLTPSFHRPERFGFLVFSPLPGQLRESP